MRETIEALKVVSVVDITTNDSVQPTAVRLFNKLKELCILLIGVRAMVTQNRIAQESALAGITLPTMPTRVIVQQQRSSNNRGKGRGRAGRGATRGGRSNNQYQSECSGAGQSNRQAARTTPFAGPWTRPLYLSHRGSNVIITQPDEQRRNRSHVNPR